jgi:acid phosphatase type 7
MHRMTTLSFAPAGALGVFLVLGVGQCRPTQPPAAEPAPPGMRAAPPRPPPADGPQEPAGEPTSPTLPPVPPPPPPPQSPDSAAPSPASDARLETGAEAPAPARPLVVIAAGDIAAPGGDQEKTAAILRRLQEEKGLAAILMLGDGAYRFSNLANYRSLYEPTWGIPTFKAITHPVPGNHEYLENGNANGYFDYWNGAGKADGPAGPRGKGYYSFDVGSWHVIALNSSEDCQLLPCGEGSAQLAWFKADLAQHAAARCSLVMVHNPRYQNGTHRGDTEELAPAWAAAMDAGVDLWVAGHEHNYQQFAPMDRTGKVDRARGIRSWVVGTGGARDFREVFDDAQMAAEEKRLVNVSGVLELMLSPAEYQWRYHLIDGTIGAAGSDVCH